MSGAACPKPAQKGGDNHCSLWLSAPRSCVPPHVSPRADWQNGRVPAWFLESPDVDLHDVRLQHLNPIFRQRKDHCVAHVEIRAGVFDIQRVDEMRHLAALPHSDEDTPCTGRPWFSLIVRISRSYAFVVSGECAWTPALAASRFNSTASNSAFFSTKNSSSNGMFAGTN